MNKRSIKNIESKLGVCNETNASKAPCLMPPLKRVKLSKKIGIKSNPIISMYIKILSYLLNIFINII